jgi:hypothetical protein
MTSNLNNYLFVTADTHQSMLSLPSAYDMALHRIHIGKWGLNSGTSYAKQLCEADRGLVYISGRRTNARCIIGGFSVASFPRIASRRIRAIVDAPGGLGLNPPEMYISIDKTFIFSHPVDIRTITDKLNFIKDSSPKMYGKFLQGGVRKISTNDYNAILSASGHISKTIN